LCSPDACDLTTIPNLIGWYDSSDRDSIIFDNNDLIMRWKDKSGNENDLIQPVNERKPVIQGEFSSKCDVGAPGSEIGVKTSKDDVWMYNKGKDFRFLKGFTFFVVLKGEELSSGWKNILSFQWLNRGISLLCKDERWEAIQKTSANWGWEESPRIDVDDMETSFLITYTSDNTRGGEAKMEINKLDNELIFEGDPIQNLHGRMYLNSTEISSMSADWLYHEIAVFDRKLEEVEKQKVQGVLAWKWHMQNQLPDNHPYHI
jgi:hypothetical protein